MPRKRIEIESNEIVEYIIQNRTSLRETAKHFGVGKDLIRNRIKNYNGSKKDIVEEILSENLKNSRF